MNLKEIWIEASRKYTSNYNSYYFKVGLSAEIIDESVAEGYNRIEQELKKLTIIEKEKILTEMEKELVESEKSILIGNKCKNCGKDTGDKSWNLCRPCYFKEKNRIFPGKIGGKKHRFGIISYFWADIRR